MSSWTKKQLPTSCHIQSSIAALQPHLQLRTEIPHGTAVHCKVLRFGAFQREGQLLVIPYQPESARSQRYLLLPPGSILLTRQTGLPPNVFAVVAYDLWDSASLRAVLTPVCKCSHARCLRVSLGLTVSRFLTRVPAPWVCPRPRPFSFKKMCGHSGHEPYRYLRGLLATEVCVMEKTRTNCPGPMCMLSPARRLPRDDQGQINLTRACLKLVPRPGGIPSARSGLPKRPGVSLLCGSPISVRE